MRELSVTPEDLKSIREYQLNDIDCQDMMNFLLVKAVPLDKTRAKWIIKSSFMYILHEGVLKRLGKFTQNKDVTPKYVVPYDLRKILLHAAHSDASAGHPGLGGTLQRLSDKYWWEGMYADTENFIKACKACTFSRRGNYPAKVPMNFVQAGDTLELLCTDACGPFVESKKGNKYVIGFLCAKTRFLVAEATPTITAADIARVYVDKVFCVFGPTKKILSDRGTGFISELLNEIILLLKARHIYTTSYRPQGNKIERVWGSLKNYLRAYVNEFGTSWCEFLNMFVYSYNTSVHRNIKISPFELMFGRSPALGIDQYLLKHHPCVDQNVDEYMRYLRKKLKKLNQIAAQNDYKSAVKRAQNFDMKARDISFKVGDLVVMKREVRGNSLEPLFNGPHRVVYTQKGSPTAIIRIDDNPEGLKYDCVHISRLKPYQSNQNLPRRGKGKLTEPNTLLQNGVSPSLQEHMRREAEAQRRREEAAREVAMRRTLEESAHREFLRDCGLDPQEDTTTPPPQVRVKGRVRTQEVLSYKGKLTTLSSKTFKLTFLVTKKRQYYHGITKRGIY